MENSIRLIVQVTQECINVEERFRKIQDNPALNGAENGFTNHELEVLEKLIVACGEATLAADAISKRILGTY